MQKLHRLALIGVVGISSIVSFSSSVAIAASPLFAVLLGGNEVSSTGIANAGDSDGVGSANVIITPINSSEAQLCFAIKVSGIDAATLAHIHQANAGINGAILVTLVPPTTGISSGCTTVPINTAQQIQDNPLGFYVNVHNAAFPSGALRGQLFGLDDVLIER